MAADTHGIAPVLYAENAEDDAFLMRRAFKKVNFPNPLVVVPSGRQAIDYLAGEGAFAPIEHHPRPCLVLLDVKMPGIGGLDVLRWIRAQPQFHDMTVLMFSSSSQQADVTAAYHHGANSYLVKPTDLTAFRELVEDLRELCQAAGRTAGTLAIRGSVPPPPRSA